MTPTDMIWLFGIGGMAMALIVIPIYCYLVPIKSSNNKITERSSE